MAPRMFEPIAAACLALLGCAAHGGAPPQSPPAQSREQIYILRSIREVAPPVVDWCAATRTGFEPVPADPERVYSFWSLRVRPDDGSVIETKAARVAELHGCFGPTSEPARQHFYAAITSKARFGGDTDPPGYTQASIATIRLWRTP